MDRQASYAFYVQMSSFPTGNGCSVNGLYWADSRLAGFGRQEAGSRRSFSWLIRLQRPAPRRLLGRRSVPVSTVSWCDASATRDRVASPPDGGIDRQAAW